MVAIELGFVPVFIVGPARDEAISYASTECVDGCTGNHLGIATYRAQQRVEGSLRVGDATGGVGD